MDFEFSESERILKETLNRFGQEKLAPVAEEIDRTDRFPEWLWSALAELGILGLTVSEEYGGAGADILSAVIVMQELCRFSPAVGLSWMAHTILCTHNLLKHCNPAQRKKYLPGLCSGEKIGALALTEPGAGSDAVNIQTQAVKKGDRYILNGTKTFITNAPIADIFLLYAKTAKEKGAKGITVFIVEKDFPGFSRGKSIEKMGHRGSPTGELVLEDCEVPEENVVMGVNQGISVMMNALDIERTVIAGGAIGLAEIALEYAVQYAREREQFGQPIGKFQFIQDKLAQLYARLESVRLLVYKTAVLASKAQRGGKGTELHKLSASSALLASELAVDAGLEAVQIFGGYSYSLEYPVNRFLRDAKLYTIGAGTNEIRKLIIARELLGF